MRRVIAVLLTMVFAVTIAACGGGSEPTAETSTGGSTTDSSTADSNAADSSAAGIRVASADDAAEIFADQPEGMVVLDVRTPEEYAEGHLEGATLIDFYDDDFADQLAELDPDTPYLLYCRSGNRSGQTRAIMDQLGFTDVVDIDGGIIAWNAGGHPLTV